MAFENKYTVQVLTVRDQQRGGGARFQGGLGLRMAGVYGPGTKKYRAPGLGPLPLNTERGTDYDYLALIYFLLINFQVIHAPFDYIRF